MSPSSSFPMQEHEQALLARVQCGEVSPHALVLHLQPYVTRRAFRFTAHRTSLEWRDLASAATVAMLERVQQALHRENPFSYLMKVARYAMIDELRALCPHQTPALLSLDTATGESGEPLAETLPGEDIRLEAPDAAHEATERTVTLALAQLKPKQRTVLVRHYGLGEHAPEPLNVIGRDLSPSGCAATAHYQYKRALDQMRLLLAPALVPQDRTLAVG